ncbi:MAG TPA: hypothetical protein VN041_13970 [Microbacterium sp.]|nr:hypothetical protein [Microbacterium sp.]
MLRWSFDLLDAQDRPLREVSPAVGGGSADIVAQSPLGGSGKLLLDDLGQGIDFMEHRLRATFHSDAASWPVGTFLMTSPVEKHTRFKLGWEVGLLTKMNIPAEDTTDARFSLAVGEPVIPAVVALLQSTGETRIAVTPSDKVRTAEVTYPAGTSKLKIINELLQSIGYWSLWCDGSGQFRIEPYADPASRPVAFEFQHGEDSLHFPEWDREQNLSDVPNKVTLVTRGDEDSEGLIGTAKNEDPASPFSFQARGHRWIGPEAETVEAESQAVLDQLAARKLADLMAPVARLKVTHAMLNLDPNALVAFTPEDGRRRLATIQRMSMNFDPFTDISAEWREVA